MAKKVKQFIPSIPIGEIAIHWVPETETSKCANLEKMVKEINELKQGGFRIIAVSFDPVELGPEYDEAMAGFRTAYPVIVERRK